MKNGQKEEAEKIKQQVQKINEELDNNEKLEAKYTEQIKEKMMKIPNIMDASVPIGKDDSENVEVQRFGEPKVPDYEIPHHADIINHFNGLDKESAGLHASMSQDFTFKSAKSPEQQSSCLTGTLKFLNKSTLNFHILLYQFIDSSGSQRTIISCFSN